MINKTSIYHLFIIFSIVSVLGFIIETLYMAIAFNILQDRGFLTLPLCPIYGTTVILCYMLLGTPQNGIISKLNCRYTTSVVPNYLYYFLIVTVLASTVEYLIGVITTDIMKVNLWTYYGVKYNLNGHIALKYSLIWGILITSGMSIIYAPLEKIINKISKETAKEVAVTLFLLIIFDYMFNVMFLIRNGHHFDII